MPASDSTGLDRRTEITPLLRAGAMSWWDQMIAPAALMLLILLQIGWHVWNPDPFVTSISSWVLLLLLIILAWVSPTRLAGSIAVLTMIAIMIIEWPTANVFRTLTGQVIRALATIALVVWQCRLRRKLWAAEERARIDSLTGLANRQALIDSVEAELSRSKRFGRPLTLAMLDCDGFKQINDVQGHLAGDEVLRRIGKSLREQTRRFDVAGRWGGDEFLIVLSESGPDDAQVAAERWRAAIRHNVERDYPTLACSLGVVTLFDAEMTWQQCVQCADHAMYQAKKLGRDQTKFDVVRACQPDVSQDLE